MKTIKYFAPVISALQRQQNKLTRRLFATGLALAGAALLALPAAGQALPDAHTMSFEVEGAWFFTGSQTGTKFGISFEGTLTGDSTLGSFSGTYAEIGNNSFRVGSGTFEFRHGSLTVEYEYQVEPRNPDFWTGTYVVGVGTGLFEGATGEGIIIVVAPGGPTGPFFLSGTLSR